MKRVFRNLSYTFVSNMISFVISAIVTFAVPKYLNAEGYGYFQLYMFYISYIGFLHFGWADGIYLRYGGKYYDELDKQQFSTQFKMYLICEILCSIIICFVGFLFISEPEKGKVITLTGIAVIVVLPKTFLQYILQCTNKMKEYAALTITEKVVYICIVICALLFHTDNFLHIIFADLIGKGCSLLYALYCCRDIITSKSGTIAGGLTEAGRNIAVGIKLMFSNIAGMLIIGIVRMAIQDKWGVATFGKVSLTLSVSNLLMVFIRAVAMVMFPTLRRTSSDKLAGIYHTMRTCLMIPLLGMLVFYFPLKLILSDWLPRYSDSLVYMALLFPMCLYESKMSMLIETYLKTLRKEKWLLFVNVITVMVSFALTMFTVYGLNSLHLAIVSIVVLLAIRSTIAELLLSKLLHIAVKRDIVYENILAFLFMMVNWFIGGVWGLVLYGMMYVIYLVLKRKDIIALFISRSR